jgi:hypothetical protein
LVERETSSICQWPTVRVGKSPWGLSTIEYLRLGTSQAGHVAKYGIHAHKPLV